MDTRADVMTDAAERVLVITRLFDAPRELVWKAWTEPEHLVHWSAPHGCTVIHCDGDLRPGGFWRAAMRLPDGTELWQGGVYREVVAPERLVFTFAWDREDGKPGHETVVTVTFADKDDKTEMRFRQEVFESVPSRDGHADGWSQSFERLTAYLAGM